VTESIPLRFDPGKLLSAWIAGTGLIVPLALAGIVRAPRRSVVALLAFVVPSSAFFLFWGTEERGGYFLGCAPALAALAAMGLTPSRRSARIALLCAVLLQGAYAAVLVQRFDAPAWERYQEERAAAVRVAIRDSTDPVRVVLFSFDEHRQPIETRLPDVVEHNLLPLLRAPEAATLSVDDAAAALALLLDDALRDPQTLLLVDLGEWGDFPDGLEDRHRSIVRAFEQHLRENYRTLAVEGVRGVLLIVEGPGSESSPR
jgi:hypothetical protein